MGERRALALHHAVALGLLHGPSELLPISSSAHTTLLPWLARWPYSELDPSLRKSFEVALHAGTAAALLLRPPWEDPSWTSGAGASKPSKPARLGLLAGAIVPPALTGYALGEPIERRLGTPATIALGLLAGSAATIGAGLHAKRAGPPSAREKRGYAMRKHESSGASPRLAASAGLRDGLALGIAQSLALLPGVSRSGATLAAARARGFSRLDADRLSWSVGLPVIAGAALLKGTQLARQGTPPGLALPLAAGAGSAFVSTLASTRALGPGRRTALLPVCAAYRVALALLVIRRMRDQTGRTPQYPKK